MQRTDNLTTPTKLGVDVALLWRGDMLAARFFAEPTTITAGPRGTFVLPAEALGQPLVPLVQAGTDAKFGLRVDCPGSEGHLIIDGAVHNLASIRAGEVANIAGATVPLTAGTRAVVVFGDFTFIISREPVPPPVRFSLWSREMLPLVLCWLVAAAIVTGPLLAAFHTPGDRLHAHLKTRERLKHRTSVLTEIAPLAQPEPKPAARVDTPRFRAPAQPTAPETPQPPPTKRSRTHRRPAHPPEDPDERRAEAHDIALNKAASPEERARIARDLAKAAADEALSPLLQIGHIPTEDLQDLAPDDVPPPKPGLHLVTHPGPAGSATDAGKALMAGLPTGESGRRNEATTTRRVPGLRKQHIARRPVRIKPRGQRAVVLGSKRSARMKGELPAKVIRDIIRRKMGAIRACYQKGLQQNPALVGKVQVRFLIQPSGSTLGAKVHTSSLRSPTVERCIVANVASWSFPRAVGGGTTVVHYPFRFSVR